MSCDYVECLRNYSYSVSCWCHYSASVFRFMHEVDFRECEHEHPYDITLQGYDLESIDLQPDQLHIVMSETFSLHLASIPWACRSTLPIDLRASTSNRPPDQPTAPNHLHITTPKAILCHRTSWIALRWLSIKRTRKSTDPGWTPTSTVKVPMYNYVYLRTECCPILATYDAYSTTEPSIYVHLS